MKMTETEIIAMMLDQGKEATNLFAKVTSLHQKLVEGHADITLMEGGYSMGIRSNHNEEPMLSWRKEMYDYTKAICDAKGEELPPFEEMTYDDLMYNAVCNIMKIFLHVFDSNLAMRAALNIFSGAQMPGSGGSEGLIKSLAKTLGGVALSVGPDGIRDLDSNEPAEDPFASMDVLPEGAAVEAPAEVKKFPENPHG